MRIGAMTGKGDKDVVLWRAMSQTIQPELDCSSGGGLVDEKSRLTAERIQTQCV
jgi:hypothetical protein